MSNDLTFFGPNKDFETIKNIDGSGTEYWLARDLVVLLGYTKWSNFEEVVKKAMQACLKSGQSVENHFAKVGKMTTIGANVVREIVDWKLDRYACYLIAQNGDSKKPQIALAQTYFAVQTRRQEVFEQMAEDEKRVFIREEVSSQNKSLFSSAKKAGVIKFGVFNDAGYRGLYGMPLTEIEKLKKDRIYGDAQASKIGGTLPEKLPPEKHIKEIKKALT